MRDLVRDSSEPRPARHHPCAHTNVPGALGRRIILGGMLTVETEFGKEKMLPLKGMLQETRL